MALGSSILSSNNLAELEDNISTLGTSVLLGGANLGQHLRPFQDSAMKNRSFSTMQMSLNDHAGKGTKALRSSQQQLKMAATASMAPFKGETCNRGELFKLNQALQRAPHGRSRGQIVQNAYSANYSTILQNRNNTLFHNDNADVIKFKENFSNFATIQGSR